MPVSTTNIYGQILISDEAIAKVASHTALDCYGIVELVTKGVKDSLNGLFNKGQRVKGTCVVTKGDKIFIDICVIIKFGVSLSAVAETLKLSVKYNVEKFTGMVVDTVNVNIVGVKL